MPASTPFNRSMDDAVTMDGTTCSLCTCRVVCFFLASYKCTRDNHSDTHGDWAHIWYKLWHTYGIACLAWNEPTYLAQIWKMHRPFKEPHIWFISATVKDRLYALACRQYYGHRQEGYHSQPLSMSNNSNVPPQYNTKKYCTTCTKGIVTQNNSGSLAQSPEP